MFLAADSDRYCKICETIHHFWFKFWSKPGLWWCLQVVKRSTGGKCHHKPGGFPAGKSGESIQICLPFKKVQSVSRIDHIETQTSLFWRNLAAYVSFLRAHINRENHIFLPWVERAFNRAERDELEQQIKDEEQKLGEDYLHNCKLTLDKMTEILEEHYGDRYRYLLNSVASKRLNYQAA